MSFDLPLNVARDLEEYAQAEHISPAEAAVKLIQNDLKARRRRAISHQPEGTDWDKYRQLVPGVDLFQGLPDEVLEDMIKGNHPIRSEKLTPRA